MPPIEDFYVGLGRRIAHLRRDRLKISQEELGARLVPRLTRATISNIEMGKQRVLAATLVQLAGLLGKTTDQLVAGLEDQGQAAHPSELVSRLAPQLGKEKATRLVARLPNA